MQRNIYKTNSSLKSIISKLNLKCRPGKKFKDDLRAWNAADEYLLDQVDLINLNHVNQIIVLEDTYGVLSSVLAYFKKTKDLDFKIYSYSDYYNSQQALEYNLKINDLDDDLVSIVENVQELSQIKKDNSVVLWKISRAVDSLEYMIRRINSVLNSEAEVYAANMVKHLPSTTLDILKSYYDDVNIFKVQKKSLLFKFSNKEDDSGDNLNKVDELSASKIKYKIANKNFELVSFPGVFSGSKIDLGTKLLVETIDDDSSSTIREILLNSSRSNVVDLGCGVGLLSILMSHKLPQANISGIDIHKLALKSARINVRENTTSNITILAGDGLREIENNSVGLVVSNPPFHSHSALDKNLSKRLFSDVYRSLEFKGYFILVGNCNLNYPKILQKKFKRVEVLKTDRRYHVILCQKL